MALAFMQEDFLVYNCFLTYVCFYGCLNLEFIIIVNCLKPLRKLLKRCLILKKKTIFQKTQKCQWCSNGIPKHDAGCAKDCWLSFYRYFEILFMFTYITLPVGTRHGCGKITCFLLLLVSFNL